MPEKVELFKVSYMIPMPETVAKQGWYWPEVLLVERGKMEREHVEHCASGQHAQLPNYIRERYGIPPLAEGAFKPITRARKAVWEKRHASAAKAATETKKGPTKRAETKRTPKPAQ
jgi:hypothetical protein